MRKYSSVYLWKLNGSEKWSYKEKIYEIGNNDTTEQISDANRWSGKNVNSFSDAGQRWACIYMLTNMKQ